MEKIQETLFMAPYIAQRSAYFLSSALTNIRMNPAIRVAASIMLTLCLFTAGILLFVSLSAEALLPSFAMDSRVVAYLRAETAPADQDAMAEELRKRPTVESLKSVTKEDARKAMGKQLGELGSITDDLRENPLPASLEITFRPKALKSDEFASFLQELKKDPRVEEVLSGRDWTGKLKPAVDALAIFGYGAAGLLTLAAVLATFYATSIAVAARRNELDLCRIVGATPFFTVFPFYLEGVILASVCALLASALLISCFAGFREAAPLPLAAAFSLKKTQVFLVCVSLWAWGAILNGLGAWLALRRSLKA